MISVINKTCTILSFNSEARKMKDKNKTSGLKHKKEDTIYELDLFDILMDNILDSIYFKDRQCRFIRINRRMMQSLSIQDMSQMIGKTDIDMFGEEYGRKTLAEDLHLMETGEPIIGLIEKRKLKKGKFNWTSTTKVPLRNDSGQIVGLVGITREINEVMETEEALAYERDLLHTLMDNIPDTIYFKDKKSRFTRINKAQARLLGVDNPEDAIGKTDFDYFTKEFASNAYKDEQKLFKKGGPVIAKPEKIRLADGQFRWVSATKVPIISKGGKVTGLVGISRDITRVKQAEDRQVQLLKEIESANTELKDFAYIVSHDLKAPLRGIGSLAEWLSTDYKDKFDEDGKELLDLLMGRIKRMHNLIDGILQYSRVGRLREEKEEVNLNELVKDVIDMIAPPENIKITVENELPSILCEKTRIGQVFQNLLSNAIKYMDKPKGKIKIGCNEDEKYWKFSISDNGPGIEEKHFEKTFQVFQTLKPRDEFESTGIGLSVVKKIIELYSGTIWVDSKIGEGSTFYFTLLKKVKI
ncbi:MAG TPA: PAS domain-containing sensor histidine kinase [Candidatus Marinimicrobia bacterium]|nr:PAS domain-containing sensor histidine kinase [Candidatus Neomarinimicrobiota bacterium]